MGCPLPRMWPRHCDAEEVDPAGDAAETTTPSVPVHAPPAPEPDAGVPVGRKRPVGRRRQVRYAAAIAALAIGAALVAVRLPTTHHAQAPRPRLASPAPARVAQDPTGNLVLTQVNGTGVVALPRVGAAAGEVVVAALDRRFLVDGSRRSGRGQRRWPRSGPDSGADQGCGVGRPRHLR